MTSKWLKCELPANIETTVKVYSVVKDCPLVTTTKRLKREPPTNIETTVKVYSVVKDCSLVMTTKRLKRELPASIETTVKTSPGLDHRLNVNRLPLSKPRKHDKS